MNFTPNSTGWVSFVSAVAGLALLGQIVHGHCPEPPPLTVKGTPLLATPPTVTTTFPVVAPEGTEVIRLVALQFVTEAGVWLNLTVLVPCADPKFVPVIVTAVPTGPEVVDKLDIAGAPCKVYVALAKALFANPALLATAFTMVVLVMLKDALYVCEVAEPGGVLPSVV